MMAATCTLLGWIGQQSTNGYVSQKFHNPSTSGNCRTVSDSMISVSCIMPTANRRRFIPATLEMFLAQDYSNKELVIVDDGADRVDDIVPKHPHIRYIGLERRLLLAPSVISRAERPAAR